ncbi:MAG: hypothetical protein KDA28_17610, partial [Phycisphaerales bacterium]|nr:hypothetical protein [Phycisphaerales bacterium]
TLAEDRNIRFVIPAEQARRLREAYDVEAPVLRDRDPTHRMSATIRSITRNDGVARTDLYAFSYDLVDIADGALVWNGSFEIKREAFGRSWD